MWVENAILEVQSVWLSSSSSMFVSCLMSSSVYDKMTFIIPMGRLAMLGPRDRIHVPILLERNGQSREWPSTLLLDTVEQTVWMGQCLQQFSA